jgi:hypothetical protein
MLLVTRVQPEHRPDCDTLTRAREDEEAVRVGSAKKKKREQKYKTAYVRT